MFRAEAFAGLLLLGILGCQTDGPVSPGQTLQSAASVTNIRWPAADEAAASAVEVLHLPPSLIQKLQELALLDQWQTVFRVGVIPETAGAATITPMLGAYSLGTNSLRFTPRFPLQPGMRYQAAFNSPLPNEYPSFVGQHELLERKPERRTVVAEVYPTSSQLPENLLKFYLQFSAPMSRGDIYRHIQLVGPNGRVIELPFLELGEELWDSELKRLTLLIDPGRIKREVKPLMDIGPVFEAGRRYSLVISSNWLDGDGVPLRRGHVKSFSVLPPDREPLDPRRWKIELPRSGTRAPLKVKFGEPLDHALALRLIRVENAQQQPLPGSASLTRHETQWQFVPDSPWTKEPFFLSVAEILEDLAGNNVGRPFEVDVANPAPLGEPVRLPLHIR